MDKINSTTRLLSIDSEVILTQTDTTVGFLSQDERKLREIKERHNSKPFIKVYKNFRELSKHGVRIPNNQKAKLRRAKKTTFIIKTEAIRVVADTLDSQVLRNTQWNYSTSANERSKKFQRAFCERKADIIIEDKKALFEGESSQLFKINNLRQKRLR